MTEVQGPGGTLSSKQVVVCVGTGGVGKTTIAAAIGLEAARRGARALVLTIDPARRLADALGVAELDNEPRELPAAMREELGIGGASAEPGQLFAMMLDMKRTFDDLVMRFADSAETRARILANPIYHHVSDALAGSAEYAAMEKVYEMVEADRFDLIVLDTPPSQHALDFLDAPRRLLEFLDSRLVKLLVHPAFSAGRFGIRLFQGTTQRVLKLVERVSGIAFLEDISEFLLAFEGMSDGFKQRAHRVQSMLMGDMTSFVLVAAPSPEAARGAERFLERLERSEVPLAGVIVNRTRLWPGGGDPPSALQESAGPGPADAALEHDIETLAHALAPNEESFEAAEVAARAASDAVASYAGLVRRDLESTAALRKRAEQSRLFVRLIPELPRDVHDLEGLSTVAQHLFADEPVPGESRRADDTAATRITAARKEVPPKEPRDAES
jgi:anion-transporting  ArsA/GET3 family ATPase